MFKISLEAGRVHCKGIKVITRIYIFLIINYIEIGNVL
jgi:hypothetical protein